MHILFVTCFNLFLFHWQIDVIGPLLLNASLLLVLITVTDQCRSLNLLTVTDCEILTNYSFI